MDRMMGLAPTEARQMVFKAWPPHVPTQPLPPGQPRRITPADVGIVDADPLHFVVIGDHGGVKDPNPQIAVATAIAAEPAAFCLSVGDFVYFNGDESQYQSQFYEPYDGCRFPIIGIPGNHDGDTTDDPSRGPLDTFLANFCTPEPQAPAADPQLEYGRHTQTLPWCDWSLECKVVTIIGLYSNVPSGGHLEQSQVDWLTSELEASDRSKPLIVCLHHPPYSADAHHGGSQKMGNALDKAFKAANLWPSLVLAGHVHDYQRFTRRVDDASQAGISRGDARYVVWIPYLVLGNSGYHNLHKLAAGATRGSELTPGVVFNYGDADEFGYVNLTVSSGHGIAGEYVGVTPGTAANIPPMVTPNKDTFAFPEAG